MLVIQEPPDGTRLAVYKGDNEWTVIWRDDAAANAWYVGSPGDQHWWDDADSDPMTLDNQLKYAEAVHLLGEQVTIVESDGTPPRADKHSFSGSVRRVGGELVDVDECARPAPLFTGDVRSCRRPASDPIHS